MIAALTLFAVLLAAEADADRLRATETYTNGHGDEGFVGQVQGNGAQVVFAGFPDD